MCNFFSFCTIGGSVRFFKPATIIRIRAKGNPKGYDFNSHASIAAFYKIDEDKANKYEFNPFSGEFKIDKLNQKDDSINAEKWVRQFWDMPRDKFVKTTRAYFEQPDYRYLKQKMNADKVPKKNQDKVIAFVEMVMGIDWFLPQAEPNKDILQEQADKTCDAFKTPRKPVRILALRTSQDWSAARSAARSAAESAARSAARSAAESAARSAARSAAWSAAESAARSAARSAAHIIVGDLLKDKYPVNPFDCLMWFWKQGLYPIMDFDKPELVIYYVPKKEMSK